MITSHCSIAYFISPHGYGHAARAAGVMEALLKIDPSVRFEIFTRVPRWFFKESLSGHFRYTPFLTDIGLVQKSALEADHLKTLERLNEFHPFDQAGISLLANEVRERGCGLVLCDIAPMGIAVAREAGVPSVLLENFTWDWIYEGYTRPYEAYQRHIHYLREFFDRADYRVQTEPVCDPLDSDLTTLPVSRQVKRPVRDTRKQLGIPEDQKVVMITMGGIPGQYPFLQQLETYIDVCFVIPGAVPRFQTRGNLRLLPHQSDFFHPDLVHASDAVIGKVGYSTLAEVYGAGVPFGYIARKRFRESLVLVDFIQTRMNGLAIDEEDYHSGHWLSNLPDLLAMKRVEREEPRGSDQAARFIVELLHSKPAPS